MLHKKKSLVAEAWVEDGTERAQSLGRENGSTNGKANGNANPN